ncbi:MAG: GGDEF domain-containing protein [Magnetovibrio sp.]|nr:GGDEF domain-containing protein [Magnetovibrio sp.]
MGTKIVVEDFLRFVKNPLRIFSISAEDLDQLIHAGNHSHYLDRHRATVMIERIRVVAAVFSALTFAWIWLDYIAFDPETWETLAIMRLCSTAIFILLTIPWNINKDLPMGFVMLAMLLANPPIFYVASYVLFDGQEMNQMGSIITTVYTMLPYIIIAGLSIFPLTAVEAIMFATPVILMTVVTPHMAGSDTLTESLATVWILVLILGVYLMAGMSQLHSMISLVHKASKDPLTDLLTRRTGAEIIDLYFRISTLHNTPFSVIFIDLDHFKSINDDYGHEAGDEALRVTAQKLHEYLRRSDVIVRWGGEEMVAVLPNTDMNGIKLILGRILKDWFGDRPEGKPLTASIGVAERISDDIDDWPELVERADTRMYQAKKTGRARAIICNDEVLLSDQPTNTTSSR